MSKLKTVEQAQFIERNHCINCNSEKLAELSAGHYTDKPLVDFLSADPWGEDPLPYLQTATWSLVRCNECTQIYHRRILNEEWNERRFSQWMSAEAIQKFESRRDHTFSRKFEVGLGYVEHALRIEQLTRHVRGDSSVRLLDFGCGFGHFLQSCSLFGFTAVGVDRSIGRRSAAAVEIMPSLGEVSGTFHAITLFEVLEHLDHPRQMLEALFPYLAPGGILVLETPDCTGATSIETEHEYRVLHPLEHINCFTHQTLKSIAKRAGYDWIDRPPVVASSEWNRIAKRTAKHLLRRDGRSTQLYFKKH
ncbi:class I SAM-dependent methyltransferase [Bradyrhizobium manausense]|uniref:class I SAM-dependent methyltransferase n=1 Tax=Bradyrhizobium manausense TaxID=989370 RepID=UPI001BA9CFDC|nr:class I SAM-dependent methyltransferase [Bradyrhizobium manausense]MBR0836977.1 class I SAM-dependent methyltransferase [Bradyrhizobium manausense]